MRVYLFSSSWYLLLLISLHVIQVSQSISVKPILKSSEEQKFKSPESNTCDFKDESKDHSISDFLKCTDNLAGNSLGPTSEEFSKEMDKIFENFQESFARLRGRQRPGAYYRPDQSIYDNLDDGFYGNYGYPGPDDPSGNFNLGLVEALSSISQYDDFKCVPRLLCEIATGSKPGNGEYKASSFQDFGKNTLIGLLTAYNLEESSPVLAFGKAALLGYTSKGDSSICYDEYHKCPNNPRDLVHYLNNHNGGFFRFFKNVRERPDSHHNRIGSNRIGHSIKVPAPPPGLSGPESDRTGTGELKFDIPETLARQDSEKAELRLPSYVFSRIIFPEDKKNIRNHRFSKSLKSDSQNYGFFPESSSNFEFEKSENSEAAFFPSDYEDEDFEKSNSVFQSVENSKEEYNNPYIRKGRILFLDYGNDAVSAVFRFPDQENEKFISDSQTSGLSKFFPSD